VAGLTAANLYIVCVRCVVGSGDVVLLGEMFPNEIRGAALAISGATNWRRISPSLSLSTATEGVGLTGAYAFLRNSRSDLASLCMAYRA